jgi:16S rRNA (adenine1518-N6/adenine1519-N6)-dimethyltransferase
MGQRYGQHFLLDSSVLECLVTSIAHFEPSLLVEIGPGKGVLTHELVWLWKELVVIEVDCTLEPYLLPLQEQGALRLVWWDALVVGWDSVLGVGLMENNENIENYKYNQSNDIFIKNDKHDLDLSNHSSRLVVGNLPYYITSPLLRKWLDGSVVGGVFLVQREVAEQLALEWAKKTYLWWCLSPWYSFDVAMIVGPRSFDPPPKVDSAVLVATRREVPLVDMETYERVLRFLDVVWWFKRKTLGKIQKILSSMEDERIGWEIPLDLHQLRIEELSWEMARRVVYRW